MCSGQWAVCSFEFCNSVRCFCADFSESNLTAYCTPPTAHSDKAERIYLYPSTLAKRGTVLLFLSPSLSSIFKFGHLPLVNRMSRVTRRSRARCFCEGSDHTHAGGHTWFEKPALLYWMIIASSNCLAWRVVSASAVSHLRRAYRRRCFVVGRKVEVVEDGSTNSRLRFWSAIAAANDDRNRSFLQGCQLRHRPNNDDRLGTGFLYSLQLAGTFGCKRKTERLASGGLISSSVSHCSRKVWLE